MEPEISTIHRIGLAKIINYEVTFENVSYLIAVRDCSEESSDRIEHVDDYEIAMVIPFTEQHNFLYWLRNPAFTAMKESWSNGENDCYFEHVITDRAALMTLNGSVVLIPVVNRS